MKYKVSKNSNDGKRRIVTDQYWLKRSGAEKYAEETNRMFPGHNARVIIDK